MNPTLIFLIVISGLEFGSFANVCIYRWPKSQSILTPVRSYCPWCKKSIAWFDNIPVLSFLFLRGKCRNCHSAISMRYPLIEIILPVIWLSIFAVTPKNYSPSSLIALCGYLLFGFFLLVTTMTDLDWKVIPDEASYALIVLGLLVSPFNFVLGETTTVRFIHALIGISVGGGASWLAAWIGFKILGKDVLGLGDVKLLAGIGAFLGWEAAFFGFLGGSIVGGVFALFGLLFKFVRRNQYLPFGPFINLATFTLLLAELSHPGFIHSLWGAFLGFDR